VTRCTAVEKRKNKCKLYDVLELFSKVEMKKKWLKSYNEKPCTIKKKCWVKETDRHTHTHMHDVRDFFVVD